MPVPQAVTKVNKAVLNKGLRHLAGHGWFVELEHRGRRSGRVFHVPLMAFDGADVVTIALTYGRGVDWLANLRSAGGGRMHLRGELLTLGAPRDLPPAEGLARMPQPPRTLLPLLGCEDWVELPVLARTSWRGW
ncbi:MAG TPA: nitroreductase family deazaflavin-dependent oxidoreductase [Humibacillus xanthopallidus]|nr:nitroreductase family deazaflavin-dependent oxidoreductase [Humibacillus xanthopallidus]